MTAMQEFVVPRSMPSILAIGKFGEGLKVNGLPHEQGVSQCPVGSVMC